MEQMPYQRFARVYDLFMADTPYGSWACYIKSAWARHGVNPGLVLDLGCGTGSLSALLREMGCDMIGVDASEEMLSEAYGKTEGILLLKQDMRELDLYGTVASIVCFCDSLNYLTDDGDLLKVFKLCHNYLDPGGLFVFDVNTYKKYNE
ncbi:MAG: class I SAM-dependent methyltransferase, partial [Clostridiales bacterium]|nr:class I SAM-dependent methyltransferase [Clostridiales bacterium]